MKSIGYLVAVGICASALTSQAIPERLDVAAYTSVGVGLEPANAGEQSVIDWLNGLIGNYNTLPGPNAILPTIGGSTAAIEASNNSVDPDGAGPLPGYGPDTFSISLTLTGYEYLALRWGGSQADQWQAYRIGSDASATFSSPLDANGHPHGLSDYRFYDPKKTTVPDGGATLLLLGSAFGLVAMFRRSIAK